MEVDKTKTQRESPYLNELDIRLNMKRHHGTSNLNPSRDQHVNTAQTKYIEPITSTDDPDIDEPLDGLGIEEPIDVLDKIEACLLSDNGLINMHDIPEQMPPDLDSIDDDDSFSHADLDSLTSVSSSTSSCSSLRSSGEFDFALPGHELDSLSSMVNNLSPFFNKLRAISNHLSNSNKDLNADSPNFSECSTLTKECQSATTSTSSIYFADGSDVYNQNGDRSLHTDAAPCVKDSESVNLVVPDSGRCGSDTDSVFSQSTASARCSQNLDSWSMIGSSRSSQLSSISSLTSSPSDEMVSLSNSVTKSTELSKPQIGTKRPRSLCQARSRHSVHSDCSSPVTTHRSYDSVSPLTASHRVSIMSLKSAFSYLVDKGIVGISNWICTFLCIYNPRGLQLLEISFKLRTYM